VFPALIFAVISLFTVALCYDLLLSRAREGSGQDKTECIAGC